VGSSPGLAVAGEASDGNAAVEAVLELSPDVVLLDLHMPVLDGFGAIERIMAEKPTPILVLTSRARRRDMAVAFEAIRRGALEVLPKPEDTATWQLLAETLPETLRLVAGLPLPRRVPAPPPPVLPPVVVRPLRFVGIGASTGGPTALRDLLAALPRPCPAALLVVQHIAPGFEAGLAAWLDGDVPLDVRVAVAGERPGAGQVRVAPADCHLRVDAEGALLLDATTPPRQGHRPSADVLLASLAEHHGEEAAGVLLSGMGNDGVEGLAALAQSGGLTLVQDEATAVLFGMPRVALERGAARRALPPAELARALFAPWGLR
jgi:two-component system chemotaxis response regulator CheB